MARQVASGLSGTGNPETFSGRDSAVLYVEFTASGDLDLEVTPNGGSTWLTSDNFSSSGVYNIRLPDDDIRVNVNAGTANVWIGE